jgi:hypothetical protein
MEVSRQELRKQKIEADLQLQRLWTQYAKTPGYKKEDWKLLQRLIWDIGNEPREPKRN